MLVAPSGALVNAVRQVIERVRRDAVDQLVARSINDRWGVPNDVAGTMALPTGSNEGAVAMIRQGQRGLSCGVAVAYDDREIARVDLVLGRDRRVVDAEALELTLSTTVRVARTPGTGAGARARGRGTGSGPAERAGGWVTVAASQIEATATALQDRAGSWTSHASAPSASSRHPARRLEELEVVDRYQNARNSRRASGEGVASGG